MFDWGDYVILAAQADDEAALRTAIGRAYYAAYGRAAEHLIARGLLGTRPATHRNVWSAFKVPTDSERWTIWTVGLRLKDQREKADYQRTFRGPLPRAANEAIERATDVLALLDRL